MRHVQCLIRVHATRAAVEEGIVAGGGVAYLRAKQAAGVIKGDNPDQEAGIKLVLKAIESPLREIVYNSGGEASVVVAAVLAGKGNYGFNAALVRTESGYEIQSHEATYDTVFWYPGTCEPMTYGLCTIKWPVA